MWNPNSNHGAKAENICIANSEGIIPALQEPQSSKLLLGATALKMIDQIGELWR